MANATLLQIVDRAWDELALGSTPATVISNTDTTVVQLLALVNGLGNDLVREHQWQAITKEYRFTTVYYQYTATISTASTTITAMSSTTGLTTSPTYFAVTGTGIPQDTMLVSVNGGASTAVLSQTPTTSGTVTLTFSQVFYDMPSDYDRLVDDTEWDKTNRWRAIGPETAQQWQWLKSGGISSGPRVRYRILFDKFQIYPPVASALYYGFEYVRKHWILAASAADVSKQQYTVDTDTCVFPDRLMIEALKLRFARTGGFDWLLKTYAPPEIQRGYPMSILSIAKTSDAGSPTLSMTRPHGSGLINNRNVQDGNWNL